MDQNNLTSKEILESHIADIESRSASAPIPVAAPKRTRGCLVATILCAVFGVAGLSFGIFEYFNANQKSAEIADCQTATCQTIDSSEEDTSDLAVRELIDALAPIASEAADKPFLKTYDSSPILVRREGVNTFVLVSKNYGLTLNGSGITAIDHSVIENFQNAISNKLRELGFAENPDLVDVPFYISGGEVNLLNSESSISCVIDQASVRCAHTAWNPLSDEQVASMNELSEAYRESEGNYPLIISSIMEGTLKNSSVSPYQTATVRCSNAVCLFYRKDSESKWQFFTGTQSVLSCSEYDSEDLKNAFAGDVCYDEVTNQNSTVQP